MLTSCISHFMLAPSLLLYCYFTILFFNYLCHWIPADFIFFVFLISCAWKFLFTSGLFVYFKQPFFFCQIYVLFFILGNILWWLFWTNESFHSPLNFHGVLYEMFWWLFRIYLEQNRCSLFPSSIYYCFISPFPSIISAHCFYHLWKSCTNHFTAKFTVLYFLSLVFLQASRAFSRKFLWTF